MTVKELIEKLKGLNEDMEIRYMDCEFGNTEIKEIKEDAVVIYNRPKYGQYEECEGDLISYEDREELDYNIISKRDIYVLR